MYRRWLLAQVMPSIIKSSVVGTLVVGGLFAYLYFRG